jgi:hypothetical protein
MRGEVFGNCDGMPRKEIAEDHPQCFFHKLGDVLVVLYLLLRVFARVGTTRTRRVSLSTSNRFESCTDQHSQGESRQKGDLHFAFARLGHVRREYTRIIPVVHGFSNAHFLEVIRELLTAIEANDISLAVGHTGFADWGHRARQAPVGTAKQQVQNRIDHTGLPGWDLGSPPSIVTEPALACF